MSRAVLMHMACVARKATAANENRVERVDSAANQVALALLSSGSYFVITITILWYLDK